MLRAACAYAKRAQQLDGEFAGAWVLSELNGETGGGMAPRSANPCDVRLLEKWRRKIIGNPTAREGAAR